MTVEEFLNLKRLSAYGNTCSPFHVVIIAFKVEFCKDCKT